MSAAVPAVVGEECLLIDGRLRRPERGGASRRPIRSRVAQEEIFGPDLVIIPHDGNDDAVALANDSAYGLSGSVWSNDRSRAIGVADRIRTGTVGINGGLWYSPDVPFGGYKQSGVGRESGVAGFEEYLETKSIAEPA